MIYYLLKEEEELYGRIQQKIGKTKDEIKKMISEL